MLLFFFVYSLTSPTTSTGTGFIFYYPLYDLVELRILFTLGTWMWVYVIIFESQRIANKQFSKKWFEIIITMSYYMYLTH